MIISLENRLNNLDSLSDDIWRISNDTYPSGSPWTREQFIEDLSNAQSIYCTLREENNLLGFISGHVLLDEAEIHHVVVSKCVQGRGYGKLLLKEFLSETVSYNKLVAIFLEARESNIRAQNLYKKCGFKTIACRKNYYKSPPENALIMTYKTAISCHE